jgi:beta-lactamase class A
MHNSGESIPSQSSELYLRSSDMRRHLWLITLLLCLLLTESSTQEVSTSLTKRVETELSHISARTGLYAKNLQTGEEVAVRSDSVFNSASVIKLAIMGLTN